MKIVMIYPQCPDTFWSFKHAIRFVAKKALHPPLGLATVATMLPMEWDVSLVDMNIQPLRNKDLEGADYVFLSAMAVQRESAIKVIEKCINKGIKIVAGGPLFTASYQDFPQIDHLILNEAEKTFPIFLQDLEAGCAKRIYMDKEFTSLDMTPIPKWSLVNMRKYFSMTIQFSRGCPYNCEFCDITTLFGRRSRIKSGEQIIAELDSLYLKGWRGNVFFVDDNFIGNKKQLKSIILPLIIKWMNERKYPFVFSTEASIDLSDDQELMGLLVEAGFDGVFVGIETPNTESLIECNKKQNLNRDMVASVKKIQKCGLQVRGGFIVGFDKDSPRVFQRQIDFIQDSGIITAMVGLLNAPKGSRLYERIVKEGRLLENITGDNTDCTTNISPKMGYETLLNGYKDIIKGIYSAKPYYERVKLFLTEYTLLKKRPLKPYQFHIKHAYKYFVGFFRSMCVLGLKDRERAYFWKLLWWSLFTKPALMPEAITYAVYGYHFRKVFARYL